MKPWKLIGPFVLAVGSLTAGFAIAADPSKADIDFCNAKATAATKASPVQPGSTPQREVPPMTGGATEVKPGTPASPGQPVQPAPRASQPGSNPTGGRITDSSQPGMPSSDVGMSPIGQTDPRYRQAYLACLSDQVK